MSAKACLKRTTCLKQFFKPQNNIWNHVQQRTLFGFARGISLHKYGNFGEVNENSLYYQSVRYKKGAKKRQMDADREANRPPAGMVLDTDDYKKKMMRHIAKLQEQLRDIQPKFANSAIVESIELTSMKNRPKIKNIADVQMRGTTHINILPRESRYNDDIIYALKYFNEHFDPRLEEHSGFIVCTVPRPSDEEIKHLRDACKRRGEYCKKECQKIMKQGLNQIDKLKDYLSNDDAYTQTVALNQLIKDQQAVIDRLVDTKLKELLRG